MGLDFLREHSGRRIGGYGERPRLLTDSAPSEAAPENNSDLEVNLDYEIGGDSWRAIDTGGSRTPPDWPHAPRVFVDGKDVGRTVAWIKDSDGAPVPVRLSQIGAIAMHIVADNEIRRGFYQVERVVSFLADRFPWESVEAFAVALQQHGYRLLICRDPGAAVDPFDFDRLNHNAKRRSLEEMLRLEKQAVISARGVPILVDGRLDPKSGSFEKDDPIVGLVKTPSLNYLHRQGRGLICDIGPGERTPAFRIRSSKQDLVSWYLRMGPWDGESPLQGVVRVEASRLYFEDKLNCDCTYFNCLSQYLCKARTHDTGYGRASTTVLPVQRAEDVLGASFLAPDTMSSSFYRITGL